MFYMFIAVLWTNIIYGVGCFIATMPLYATVHFHVQQFAIGIEILITCLKDRGYLSTDFMRKQDLSPLLVLCF